MFNLPEAADGAVIASVVAAFISLIGLIISKEQKTSDFRQAWIDALREEIAIVIANVNSLHGAQTVEYSTLATRWKAVAPHMLALNNATAKIRLRLNPSEELNKDVLDGIETLEKMANAQQLNAMALNATEKDLAEKARKVLKAEWRRVQKGELVFSVAKLLLLLFLLFAMGYLADKLYQDNMLHIRGSVTVPTAREQKSETQKYKARTLEVPIMPMVVPWFKGSVR